jgi:hypothetical protein
MPFKRVSEASSFGFEEPTDKNLNTIAVKFVLDGFNITTDIAPSICIAMPSIKKLQMLSLVDTILCDAAFKILIRGVPKSLLSLDISKNENLSVKSYRKLHNLYNLRHLNVE